MFLKVLRDISKPHWYEIIILLKRSVGMSVAELAKALGMSYMGVKQHCVDLEKLGYLDTWRRPKKIGRPEKAYRLTEKANVLFPEVGPALTLEILALVQESSGANAAEKLLYAHFQRLGQTYLDKVNGEVLHQRATSLSRIRNYEGRLSKFELGDEGRMTIIEFNDPMRGIAGRFSSVSAMEEKMFERVLGCAVNREVESASALTRITFHLG